MLHSTLLPLPDIFQHKQQQQHHTSHLILFAKRSIYSSTITMSGGHLIVLDVGGKTFKTSRSTLLMSGSGYFHGRFTTGETLSNNSQDQKDLSLLLFIDRDGSLFDEVLFYMRTGNLRAKTKMAPSLLMDLKVEAAYYAYDQLATSCQQALNSLEVISLRLRSTVSRKLLHSN